MAATPMISEIRDFHLLLVLPIVAYWISASIFHFFDCQKWFQSYKIHSPEAEEKRNRATLGQVFRQVLAQQLVQVIFALLIDRTLSSPAQIMDTESVTSFTIKNETWENYRPDTSPLDMTPRPTRAWIPDSIKLVIQLASAIVVADTWQYFWHRIFHSNKFLYRHVHSVHHRLYVPYSYGALYSSLTEAFIVDTLGTTITFYICSLPIIPATWFACLSIIKSVNDHSGYRLPYNPFNYVSRNTTDFHDVHHQPWGFHSNYSQIYLTVWDDLLGTAMSAEEIDIRRKGRDIRADDDVENKKIE